MGDNSEEGTVRESSGPQEPFTDVTGDADSSSQDGGVGAVEPQSEEGAEVVDGQGGAASGRESGEEQGQAASSVSEAVEIDVDSVIESGRGEGISDDGQAPGSAEEAPAEDGEVLEQAEAGQSEADRIAELELVVEELRAELDRTKNQLLRVAADFDNYRKRMQRQMGETEARAAEKVLVEVLPVMDSLLLALDHSEGDGGAASLAEGLQLVAKQFHSILSKLGVEPIDAIGQPFDPTYHEAMQQEENGDVPPGTVVKEWQKGYRIGERLLRPSMVVVSAAPAGGGAEPAAVDEQGDVREGSGQVGEDAAGEQASKQEEDRGAGGDVEPQESGVTDGGEDGSVPSDTRVADAEEDGGSSSERRESKEDERHVEAGMEGEDGSEDDRTSA